MTLTSPAPTVIKQRRLEALTVDLRKTLEQCRPHFFTPNPKHNTRYFVITADDAAITKGMCSRKGSVQRSELRERITAEELRELIKELCAGKYQIKADIADLDGSWRSYRIEYSPYDEWA